MKEERNGKGESCCKLFLEHCHAHVNVLHSGASQYDSEMSPSDSVMKHQMFDICVCLSSRACIGLRQ